MNESTTIRQGKKKDLPRVLELIKELAAFEKAPHEVINTVELMEPMALVLIQSTVFLSLKMNVA